MQTVYAIRLDVVGVDVFDHLVSLTEAWLTRDTPLSGMEVLRSGRDDRTTLSVTTPWGTSERKIAWERAERAGAPARYGFDGSNRIPVAAFIRR